jgi:hypothetical protein
VIVQVPEKTCVAATTERSSPGQLALIVRRSTLFVPAPFSILSHSYPETAAPSSKKRKGFRPSPIWRFNSIRLHHYGFLTVSDTLPEIYRTPANRFIDAGVQA